MKYLKTGKSVEVMEIHMNQTILYLCYSRYRRSGEKK